VAAYYNEIEPFAAQWLRNLIAAGHIAPGEVDERSIVDVRADDLRGFTQCHFFAGIGVWSHALRNAGWDDEREVWTGSCPCQPFSSAGRGGAFNDERHLWPHFFRLIQEQRPDVVFGEQVASKDGLAWLDFVCADLEGEDYSVGAVDTCAAGFGAPHIRQRLYWVADTGRRGVWGSGLDMGGEACGAKGKARQQRVWNDGGDGGAVVELAYPTSGRCERKQSKEPAGIFPEANAKGEQRKQSSVDSASIVELVNADKSRCGQDDRKTGEHSSSHGCGEANRSSGGSDVGGFWGDLEWLPCRDGKARPTKPGLFPLAHGVAGRVGRLRAYGNAIVAPQAQAFIESFMECRP